MNIQDEYDNGRQDFKGLDLTGTFLVDAELKRADFTDANFTDADLTGVCLNQATLMGATFTRVLLRYADLVDANFAKADLTGARLYRADLTGATLTNATLTDANFTDASLARATLAGVVLASTNLSYVSFMDADLTDADFTGAILANTNLMGTRLTGAVFTSTCLDPEAIIPSLTDKEIFAAGLQPVGEWVYGWRTERSKIAGDTKYVLREEPYVAPVFSVSQNTPCHPGIYLASRKWLADHYGKHEPVVRCHCKRDELIHAGDKWRTRRLWIEENQTWEHSRS